MDIEKFPYESKIRNIEEESLEIEHLGSRYDDFVGLEKALEKIGFPFKDKTLLHNAFESVVQGPLIKPSDPSLSQLGQELLELILFETLFQSQPRISVQSFLEKGTTQSSEFHSLKSLIEAGLEPFIRIYPNVDSNYFGGIDLVCRHLAHNAYTSLIGAIYIERGFQSACKFIRLTHRADNIDFENTIPLYTKKLSPKQQLKELSFTFKKSKPIYQLIENTSDPDGNIIFKSVVLIDKEEIGQGMGSTLSESQEKAAIQALKEYFGYTES